ncbi:hypothetical protein [uncultured Paraglaciecola sp.]|uniref:hypothetical protein n=1 Tax=uncultured Paraglaciecola sp. TaxID=1765024 RepID=UPI00262F8390|nr:hypothetical protein [uncultured Paraglaciecola sp.]
MNKYWVSWHHYEEMGDFFFKDEFPCWEYGFIPLFNPMGPVDITYGVCANIYVSAIKGDDLNHVKSIVEKAYENDIGEIDFRFILIQPDDWNPFTKRFPRADWMEWD